MAWWLSAALAMGVAAPAFAAPDEALGPLPWRIGGPIGFTVDAAAFPDSERYSLEVYVRIPPASLASLTRIGDVPARLRLALRLRNRFGAKQQERSQEFVIAPGDTGGGFGKVVVVRFPVASGGHRLYVRIEDPQSRKRGLAYIGRTVNEGAEIEGELLVPSARAGREISDIEFEWAEAPSASMGFAREGVDQGGALPNPERLYGLMAGVLRASFVARVTAIEAGAWRWEARVLDAQKQVVAHRDSVGPAGPRLAQTVSIDVSTIPAGGYDLEVKAWRDGDRDTLSRRSHFSIAWQPSAWMRNPRDIEDDVHFLLDGGEDEESFARMHPGEQERYLEFFWRRRDPTPETAENETRIAFHRRVEHANANWGRPRIGKGMFADMGRVYIRYGEPDEVLKQVLPAGDQTLSYALRDLELSEDRPTGDVHAKGIGGDTRPFEVWIYDRENAVPLIAALDGFRPPRKRLVFLFVDEQGYGDYTLRYTTE